METQPIKPNELSEGTQQALGEVVVQIVECVEKAPEVVPTTKQRAIPPDLISGQLSPKNAEWLKTQQDKAEAHRRASAIHNYRYRKDR